MYFQNLGEEDLVPVAQFQKLHVFHDFPLAFDLRLHIQPVIFDFQVQYDGINLGQLRQGPDLQGLAVQGMHNTNEGLFLQLAQVDLAGVRIDPREVLRIHRQERMLQIQSLRASHDAEVAVRVVGKSLRNSGVRFAVYLNHLTTSLIGVNIVETSPSARHNIAITSKKDAFACPPPFVSWTCDLRQIFSAGFRSLQLNKSMKSPSKG